MSYFSDIEQELIALIEDNVSVPVTLDYVYEENSDKAVVINNISITYDNDFALDNGRKTMSLSLGVIADTHDDLNAILSEIDSMNGKSGTSLIANLIVTNISYGVYDQDSYTADVNCEVEVYGSF